MREESLLERRQLMIFSLVFIGLLTFFTLPMLWEFCYFDYGQGQTPYRSGYSSGVYLNGVGWVSGIYSYRLFLAQLLLPAVGAMTALLLTRRQDARLPRRFFKLYIALAVLLGLFLLVPVLLQDWWPAFSYIGFILLGFGALLPWLMLYFEAGEGKIRPYGLQGGSWRQFWRYGLLLFGLLVLRGLLLLAVGQQVYFGFLDMQLGNFFISLFFCLFLFGVTAFLFFGQEYGWCCFLQPLLQKRLGPVLGVLVCGVGRGLVQLPLVLLWVAGPETRLFLGVQHLVYCISLGFFFGWVYYKTQNVWLVAFLNSLAMLWPVFRWFVTPQSLFNDWWGQLTAVLSLTLIVFAWPVFTRAYRENAAPLPTLNERADN